MLLSVAVLLGSLSAVFPGDAASFCGSRVVRDYEAPLRALPPANPVPSLLPFGPPGLEATSFRSTGDGLLYRGARPTLLMRSEGGRIELNWGGKFLVSRPAADGSIGKVVSERVSRIKEVDSVVSASLFAGGLTQLGSYRIDTLFESQSGEVLGRYFEYVQVVPLIERVRLALSRRVVPPGGRFKVRLENLGTQVMSYGFPYALERHHGGRWRPVPQERAFFMPGLHLQAGEASACQGVRLSAEAEPGLYRIRKLVSVAPIRSESKRAPEKAISKTFWVRLKNKPTA